MTVVGNAGCHISKHRLGKTDDRKVVFEVPFCGPPEQILKLFCECDQKKLGQIYTHPHRVVLIRRWRNEDSERLVIPHKKCREAISDWCRYFQWLKWRCFTRVCEIQKEVSRHEATLMDYRSILKWWDRSLFVRNRICLENLDLAYHWVKKANRWEFFDELLSASSLALIQAVESFDADFGRTFSTYASLSIKRRMRLVIGSPVDLLNNSGKISFDVVQDLYGRKDPSREARIEMWDLVNCGVLTYKERDILLSRFGLGKNQLKTLEDLGNDWGVSRERIRQIEAEALAKLRRVADESFSHEEIQ